MFILHTKPRLSSISEEEITKIQPKLKEGISESEIQTILDWIIYSVRRYLNTLEDIFTSPLEQYDQLCTDKVTSLVHQLGLEVGTFNFNNVKDCLVDHIANIVYIKCNNGTLIEDRIYLVDCTYRKFFTTDKCNINRYTNDAAPDLGLYVSVENYKKFLAEELISNGYIELTDSSAKLIMEAYILASRNLTFYDGVIPQLFAVFNINEYDSLGDMLKVINRN